MLPSPSSSPQQVLAITTNISTPTKVSKAGLLPLTPPSQNASRSKRKSLPRSEAGPSKRRKSASLSQISDEESESTDLDDFLSDSDIEIDAPVPQNRLHPHNQRAALLRPPHFVQNTSVSTLPILRTFVSSHKSDVFKCESMTGDAYLTPPYACAFSNGAKSGRGHLLAVGTEQGTVHIMNTLKRKDYDAEPPHVSLQSHHNGIFDIKWSHDDNTLLTASGDYSLRVTDIAAEKVTHLLSGHTSTVKCSSWDPTNPSLLASGGRDGTICLWDLRVSAQSGEFETIQPVMSIYGAHEDTVNKSKPKVRRGKNAPAPRSITGLLYPDSEPFGLISSCSFNGALKYWDLRAPSAPRTGRAVKPKVPNAISTSDDPTVLHGSRRSRGMLRLAAGTGPTRGLLFGLGADSHIHSYSLPSLQPHLTSYTHQNMAATSFYLGLSVSPCGRWLACGGAGPKGRSYVFDIENACRPGFRPLPGLELSGQNGEACAVDWGFDQLASCADDGVVRVWRPDLERRQICEGQPEECSWDWSWAI